jgi:hypothetical protein
VIRPERLLADGERPAAAQLGVGVTALQALERGERVERARDLGMLRPQHALVDGEGAAEQRLGLSVAALRGARAPSAVRVAATSDGRRERPRR